jgi:hypothetical protein
MAKASDLAGIRQTYYRNKVPTQIWGRLSQADPRLRVDRSAYSWEEWPQAEAGGVG